MDSEHDAARACKGNAFFVALIVGTSSFTILGRAGSLVSIRFAKVLVSMEMFDFGSNRGTHPAAWYQGEVIDGVERAARNGAA